MAVAIIIIIKDRIKNYSQSFQVLVTEEQVTRKRFDPVTVELTVENKCLVYHLYNKYNDELLVLVVLRFSVV